MKQVTMYKIPHTHVTTEALLCAMYDVVRFTGLQISEAHNQWNH